MKIRFNGELVRLEEAVSLLSFLQSHLDDSDAVIARSVIAINFKLLPKHEYGQYILQENDDIELLAAVVGG